MAEAVARPESDGARYGSGQFALAFRLALGGWIGCLTLQLLLYLRPGPYGGAFLVEWPRYFWLALYYDLLGVWALSLPFFLAGLVLYRRPLHAAAWRWVAALQLGLLTLNLALGQVDHEVLRYLGLRLNGSFLAAYAQPQMLGDSLFLDLLGADRGGAFLPLLLLVLVPGAYLWWGLRQLRAAPGRQWPLWLALVAAIVPLAAPANAWRMATSEFRLRKVEPLLLALIVDARTGFADRRAPADLARLIAEYRANWLVRSTDRGWRFPDPTLPYLRVPERVSTPAPAERWNIIHLQLESLRGADMGALNPDLTRSPTPYLDRLAQGPHAALWMRATSFGMPSINGLFATHCAIAPPSQRYITTYRHIELYCLPERLRRLGYRTEMFNGGDTDWDNSSPWLHLWYDRLWRFPEADGRDREIFRGAASGLRRLGRSGQPFFASIVSVSNHTPFRNPEPALDIAGQDSLAGRIRNTTHYTDDVVRELLEGLRREPWFARTLVVIVGDHGFNTGEHGPVPGQHDLYRESVWVPLMLFGAHPRLPAGRHDGPASLLDVAPTLADLLGLREANPWQGHSLLAVNKRGALGFGFRDSLLSDDASWSAVRDPRTGAGRLYDNRSDWRQRSDLAGRHPALTRRLLDRAEQSRRLNDYLLRQGRVWRSSPS
ncbi:MAG: LTA synthase family protein [Sphingosinicella sp.]